MNNESFEQITPIEETESIETIENAEVTELTELHRVEEPTPKEVAPADLPERSYPREDYEALKEYREDAVARELGHYALERTTSGLVR